VKKLTACPVCQSVFRVDEASLISSSGQARCGQCLHVFDAQANWVDPATVLAQLRSAREGMPSHTAPSLLSQLPRLPRLPSFKKPSSGTHSTWAFWKITHSLRKNLTSILRWISLLGLWGLCSAAWLNRNTVLSQFPQTEPMWLSVCAWLYPRWDCHLAMEPNIDALELEGVSLIAQATFQPQGQGLGSTAPSKMGMSYSLQWMLRNRANHPVALPALALKLTDAQGQGLSRWTLEPSTWLRGREFSLTQIQQEKIQAQQWHQSGAAALIWRMPAQAQWAVITPLAAGSIPEGMRGYRAWLLPTTSITKSTTASLN
jgi:predicted Zn finger-like uncharacterized protein